MNAQMLPKSLHSHEPRATGGCSLHEAFDPGKCLSSHGVVCGPWRVVDCCRQIDEHDIEECARCGRQVVHKCSFDDEYA